MYWLLSEKKQKSVRETIDSLVFALSRIDHTPDHADQIFPFQGRKSIDQAKTVIEVLTASDSVICDPFVGSGTFGYASAQTGRRTLVNEYEPYTYRMMSAPYSLPDKKSLESAFKNFLETIKPITDHYYRTICSCGNPLVADSYCYDRVPLSYKNITLHERLGKNGENVTFRGKNKCKKCGDKEKFFDDFDQQVLDDLNLETDSFPEFRFIENSRINLSKEYLHYKSLFPKRSRIVASKIWESLQNSGYPIEIQKAIEDVFLSIVPLLKFKDYRSKSQDLHCPKVTLRETNPYNLLASSFSKRLKRLYEYNLSTYSGVDLSCKDFRIFLSSKEAESIDLIITDPPWHDGSAYFERAQLYHPWIGFDLKLDADRLANEVIVTDSPERLEKQDPENWWQDMNQLFAHAYRVLKSESFLVLYFRPVPAAKWISNFNRLKLLARKNGFEPLLTIDLSNKDPSMRIQQSAHYAFSSDLILTFLRLDSEQRRFYMNDYDIDELGFKAAVTTQDREARPFTRSEWFAEMHSTIKTLGILQLHQAKNRFMLDNVFLRVCEDRKDGTFLPKGTTPYSDEIFNVPYIERVSLYVPYVIEELLSKSDRFTFDQFLLKIAEFVENGTRAIIEDILGDSEESVSGLLELYAEPIEGGKYFTKRPMPKIPEHIVNVLELDPNEFEIFVGRLLELEGFTNVAVSGRSGDRGVDVRCNDSKGRLVIVQCKRYTKSNIGSTPIQRLHSFAQTRGASRMICVTTTDFTPDGVDEARLTKVELINRTKLEELVHKHKLFG